MDLSYYKSKDLWDVAVAVGIQGCKGKTAKDETIRRIEAEGEAKAVAKGQRHAVVHSLLPYLLGYRAVVSSVTAMSFS